MLLNNTLADFKARSTAFSGGFCGEERFEYPLQILFRDTASAVRKRHHNIRFITIFLLPGLYLSRDPAPWVPARAFH